METDVLEERLRALDTAHVSDAMDRLGIAGQCLGIQPLDRSFRLVGRAWTVRYGPVGITRGTVGDYIDDVEQGRVVVLDNQGRPDATVWGDLLTLSASRRRVAGTVIDGVCRDTDRAFELSYPIFSRGHWMRTGKDRVQVEAIGGPVSIAGVRVEQGDWLLGDSDGVVCIPVGEMAAVLAAAAEIRAVEDGIRRRIEDGTSLRAARAEFGYHGLQSRAGTK